MKEKLPNSCKPIAMVYETMDYDLFSFVEQNRKTDHVNNLIVSFQERDVPNAILCNDKLQIIDGQNRFLARKKLGLPILFYCIDDLDIYDVAFLNSYGKNWGKKDFVEMWASLGKEEFIKIKKFTKLYPDFSLASCINLLQGSLSSSGRKHRVSPLKNGTFKVADWDKAIFIANAIMEYKPFTTQGTSIYKHDAFISAMLILLRSSSFNNQEMVNKVATNRGSFYKCQTTAQYVKMLEYIWNYKRKINKKTFVV